MGFIGLLFRERIFGQSALTRRLNAVIERLIRRIRASGRLAGAAQEIPVGDSYHGERARNYLEKRTGKYYWDLEQAVIANILREVSDGISVLDVPFGTGRFVPFYLKKEMKVFGLDTSIDMFHEAQGILGARFSECKIVAANATHIPFASSSFDLIVCNRFLSHVVSIQQAMQILDEFWRVTRGQLAVQFRVNARRNGRPRYPRPNEAMGGRFDESRLSELLDEKGFLVREIYPLERRRDYWRGIFLCDRKRGRMTHGVTS